MRLDPDSARMLRDDGTPVDFRESPNHSGELVLPRLIVVHYTAGRGFEQSCAWLCNPKAKASAHFVVGRGGAVMQLVRTDRKAWHAGRSECQLSRKGEFTEKLVGLNRYSLGVEFDNFGELKRRGDGRWMTWFREVVPDEDVVVDSQGNGWHAYTDDQIQAGYEVCEALIDAYPSLIDVVPHSVIAPGRKFDTGFAFPLRSFQSWLLGRGAG